MFALEKYLCLNPHTLCKHSKMCFKKPISYFFFFAQSSLSTRLSLRVRGRSNICIHNISKTKKKRNASRMGDIQGKIKVKRRESGKNLFHVNIFERRLRHRTVCFFFVNLKIRLGSRLQERSKKTLFSLSHSSFYFLFWKMAIIIKLLNFIIG